MAVNPHQFHSRQVMDDNLTVEEIFNPLMGFWRPPCSSRLEKGAPHCVTIGQLFNPLLDLENLHAESHFPNNRVPPTSLSSINACRPSHIELSSLYSLDGLADCNDLTRSRKKRVHFSGNDDVVHWIPSHRDYSQKEYTSMWSNPDEIAYNASRNRIEFRFEGWDWRAVLEESKFVLCTDGELYHPITVHLYLQQLRREETIRLAVRKRGMVSGLSEVPSAKKRKLLQ